MRNLIFTLSILAMLGFCFLSCCEKQAKPDLKEKSTIDTINTLNTITFGSCNKQWMNQDYWEIIADEDPDMWIWMGDIVYSDTEDMEQLKDQYIYQKKHPEYQKFCDSIRVLGIWDDHDYGVNDGGNSYPKKLESRDLLFDFLDIDKSEKFWQREGAYQSYVFGKGNQKVKIILLDGRYFRDDLLPDNSSKHRYLQNINGSYLGEEQWKWLEEELIKSEAAINFLVSGIQVIPTEHFFEKWSNFPNERQRLFNLLEKTKVRNPIFLSGDRHIGEISKLTLESGVELIDVTSSGLTHSYEKANEENAFRHGPLTGQKNYGKINIGWGSELINIELILKDISGKELNSLVLEREY